MAGSLVADDKGIARKGLFGLFGAKVVSDNRNKKDEETLPGLLFLF